MWKPGRPKVAWLAAVAFLIAFGGCAQKPPEAPPPPPAVVTVSQPIVEQVRDFSEFTGTVQPIESVDIRARVKGFLKKVDFTDGDNVKQGDLLYEIEPDVYRAAVDAAQAELDAAKAQLQKASADLSIKQEMAAGNAASKLDVIQSQAAVYVATASVEMSNAKLEEANINLSYTKVYAPISGRIDRTRVDAGNLVGADGDTLLANIVQISPIYVYFDVDEATVQRFQARMLAKGIIPGSHPPNLSLTLALGDTGDFAFAGKIDYVDNRIDPNTGTISVRGVLPNENRAILPGFFARVRIPDGEPYQAILVPERAIGTDQGQKYVLVVDDQNKVVMRPIDLGSQHGRMRVVAKGLNAGEWVITEGLLRTRPGATVAPDKQPVSPVESESDETSNATTQP